MVVKLVPESELFHFWKCLKQYLDVTAWRVRNVLEGIRIGVELSVVFRVFPEVFTRSLLIQQRRGNGERLVH